MGNNFKLCKNVSKEDIVEDIVLYTRGNDASSAYRDKVSSIISRSLNKGWCSIDIYSVLNKNDDLSLANIEKKLTDRPPTTNLLVGRYRTHNQMQIVSKSPIIKFDETDILSILEDDVEYKYYMEERASYNFEDLLEYIAIKKKHFLLYDEKKIKGALNYILDTVSDINIVLFMIDMAISDFSSRNKKITNPLCILDYAEKAIERHRDIANRIKYGDIKFIPRRRYNC